MASISVYEVFKRILQQRDESQALRAVAAMVLGQDRRVRPAPGLERREDLVCAQAPMADSIMLAAARAHGAVLWTQDAHFEGWKE